MAADLLKDEDESVYLFASNTRTTTFTYIPCKRIGSLEHNMFGDILSTSVFLIRTLNASVHLI